jgi:transposase-like protein
MLTNKKYISISEWKKQIETMRQWLNEAEENPPSFITNMCCPDCGSQDVARNGTNEKRHQKYKCLNSSCSRYSFTIDS